MDIQIRIVQGPAADCSFIVKKNTKCVVGRGDDVDFRIDNDELISREHFCLEYDGHFITLTDLGTTNGTFVNGQPLQRQQPVQLQDGQSFVAGRKSKFVVRLISAKEPTPRIANEPQALPGAGGNRNFGASIYQEPGGGFSGPSAAPPPASSAGGNFSQSIVSGIGGDSGERSSLIYESPSSVSIDLSPVQSEPSSPSSSDDYQPPASFDELDKPPSASHRPAPPASSGGFQSSIAAPGSWDRGNAGFAPLPGAEPADPSRPPDLTPLASTPAPELPPESPSISATPPPPEPPAQHQASPFASIVAPSYVPAEPPANQPPPPAGGTPLGSIGLPGQVPQAPDRQLPGRHAVEAVVVPEGKIGFQAQAMLNGIWFHRGTEVDDVADVAKLLKASFESVYCVHFSKADVTPQDADARPLVGEIPPPAGDGASNFVDAAGEDGSDQSPFAASAVPEQAAPNDALPETAIVRVGEPLFHWMPAELRWDNPVLIRDDEMDVPLAELWNKDAVIGLFGSSGKQIREHCLDLIQMNLRSGKKDGVLFGFCWPSVLEPTLASLPYKQVARIFAGGVAMILLEDPGQEHGWNLVSTSDQSEWLKAQGLIELAPPDEGATV